MIHMMSYKKWDILVTQFPFADAHRAKKRPVLCISSFSPKENITLCWVLMITSSTLSPWRGDVLITDREKAGLPIDSIIRTAKIACIDVSLIQKKVGTIDMPTRNAVRSSLARLVK